MATQTKNFTKEEVSKVMFKSNIDNRLAIVVGVKPEGLMLEMEGIVDPRFFSKETLASGFTVMSDPKMMVKAFYVVKCNKRGVLPRLTSEATCWESAEYIFSCFENTLDIPMVEIYSYLIELKDQFEANA